MTIKKEKSLKDTLKSVSKKPNKESIVNPEISDNNHKVSEINHVISEKISNKKESPNLKVETLKDKKSPDFNNADMFTLTASSIKAIAQLKSDILSLRNSIKEYQKKIVETNKLLSEKHKTLAVLNKKDKVKQK